MAVAQFIIVFCLVVIFVFFTIVLCGVFGVWAWTCVKDDIADWKQYRLKDRGYYYPSNASQPFQEYNELMNSLQEVKDSMRAKGLD